MSGYLHFDSSIASLYPQSDLTLTVKPLSKEHRNSPRRLHMLTKKHQTHLFEFLRETHTHRSQLSLLSKPDIIVRRHSGLSWLPD